MSFRGINTTVIQIRRQVFTEVARMAYANVKGEQANHLMRKIPYTIIPGEEGKLRKDIFLERAIVEERVRLAMGLPTRRMDEHNSVVSGLEDASIADKYYDPPLVNVIKFACNRCPEKLVKVSDLCTVDEAHDFLEEVPGKLSFMATSCCPAWSMMAKTAFPDLAKNISMTMTPMVFTARMMKQADPEARMCFIGPCAAKKLEASRRTVRSDVDFVLTFEELAGIIEAKDIDAANLEVDPDEVDLVHASSAGRGFAQSGGVAKAVADKIKEWHPDMDVKIASAQGLAECKKLLMLAKAGKYNGYLLEGMACPGGCIAGAGTLADPAKSVAMLNKYKNEATMKVATETPYQDSLDLLHY